MPRESQSRAAPLTWTRTPTRYTSAGAALSGFGVLLLVVLCGCAGATAEQPSLDAAFARIQVHEAEIERARMVVQGSETGCEQACASANSAGREQAALCQLAQRVDDTDALARCSRAQHTAAGLSAQAARRCGCR